MDPETYEATQSQVMLLAGLLREMPLADFISAIEHAHAMGWIIDPTAYRKAISGGNLELIETTARALFHAQCEIRKALEKALEKYPALKAALEAAETGVTDARA